MEKGDKPKKSKAPKAKPKKEPKVSPKDKPKKQKKQRKIDSSIKQTVKVIVGSGSGAEPKRKEISKQTTYITLDRPYQLSQEDEDKLSITKFIKKEPTATLSKAEPSVKTVVSNPLNEIPKANSQDIEITSLPIALDLPPSMEIAKKKRKQSRTVGKKVIGKIPVSERLTEVQAGYQSFPSNGDETTEEILRQEREAIRFLEKYQKPIELEEMTIRGKEEEEEMRPVRIEEGFEEVQEKRKVGRPKKYTSEEAKIIKNIQTKESNQRRALLRKQEKIAQLDMEYQQFLENEAFKEGLDEGLSSDFLSKSVDELGEQNNFSAIQSNQGPNEGGGDDILFE